jgi:hypothetical protein
MSTMNLVALPGYDCFGPFLKVNFDPFSKEEIERVSRMHPLGTTATKPTAKPIFS